jgi:phage tail sheath protein FI
MVRIDAARGVWKAPASERARHAGVERLSYTLSDDQKGVLNRAGLNCLRTVPVCGSVVWGGRTLAGRTIWTGSGSACLPAA